MGVAKGGITVFTSDYMVKIGVNFKDNCLKLVMELFEIVSQCKQKLSTWSRLWKHLSASLAIFYRPVGSTNDPPHFARVAPHCQAA